MRYLLKNYSVIILHEVYVNMKPYIDSDLLMNNFSDSLIMTINNSTAI